MQCFCACNEPCKFLQAVFFRRKLAPDSRDNPPAEGAKNACKRETRSRNALHHVGDPASAPVYGPAAKRRAGVSLPEDRPEDRL